MSNEAKEKSNIKILIGVIIALLIGMVIVGYLLFDKTSENEDLNQEITLSKQQLEDEYENLTMQYEGFKINMKNDSLLDRLTNEQTKVQNLLNELKTVKATNKQEIARLNNELASLRKILRSYIVQIDSLNKANEQLRKENKEISNKYYTSQKNLKQISEQKESLTEKVSLAAKLDAVAINIQGTNSKGKTQKKIYK